MNRFKKIPSLFEKNYQFPGAINRSSFCPISAAFSFFPSIIPPLLFTTVELRSTYPAPGCFGLSLNLSLVEIFFPVAPLTFD
jgi:hypothetical protein